jgi:hypothetical protein
MAPEERIDELYKKVYAPVLDKQLADGKIVSWGWNSHVLGGKYRRLGTVTANDFSSLMKARAEMIESVYGDGNNAEAIEFDNLCNSHADYLWDIEHEKRAM